MDYPVISADSHITEPGDTYSKHIDPKFRDRAPYIERQEGVGDLFVIPGMKMPIPMGLVAAAGKRPEDISLKGTFEEWHRGGWDPEARLADQDRDGIAAEILYPTVGMPLCNHEDADYKKACFDAYNLWITEYCEPHPERLLGVGQTAMRSPEEGIEDLRHIKDLGLRGVMLPGHPTQGDYDSPAYDAFWEAAVDLGLPLSFHILTTRDRYTQRGSVLNFAVCTIRANQDIISMLIYGGVFERHPRLRVVCAEADAGWVPHFMYRMDHAYQRHRHWLETSKLSKLPSEYFSNNIYVTFQDDFAATHLTELSPTKRLMWASDFPHNDGTYPNTREVISKLTNGMSAEDRTRIIGANVTELYGLAS